MTVDTEPDLLETDVPAEPGPADVGDDVRRRLVPPMPADGVLAWVATIGVALIAAVLRLVGLASPKGKIFDEIYYAVDAHNLTIHGVEWNSQTGTGGFIVHPPLGKWIIGLGEVLFGYNDTGWRIMSVVAGVAAVVIAVRLGRRLFRSTVLGCAAGLLISLDGMEFVSSRVALLDIFLMVFTLAAFAALVLDREAGRRRFLAALEATGEPTPRRTWRTVPWWRLAAGVLTGCALAVKWSAIWYLLLFLVLLFVWEAHTRKAAGVKHAWRDSILDEIGWTGLFFFLTIVTYVSSWAGWLATDQGYDRHWLANNGHAEPPIIGALYNLYHYHVDILNFHTGLTKSHPYQSWPWEWLVLGRPVAYYYSNNCPHGGTTCSAEVVLLGTPVLWWAFLPALVVTLWWAIAKRDWRAWAILGGSAMGILPWVYFQYSDHRTMFYFYALPSEPFLVLAVVLVLGMIIGPPGASRDRRLIGGVIAGTYLVLVALCFLYFYPLYVGESIPYQDWYARMWLGNRWI
jgi:dolichyl-phosphate-mannose--protein O-mannosyl transferase